MLSRYALLILLPCALLVSCATGKQYINTTQPVIDSYSRSPVEFSIYALGDAGEDNPQCRSVMAELAKQAGDDSHPGMIIFLGDNIYPDGLADPSDKDAYEAGSNLIKNQVDLLRPYKRQIVYVPGNHDWNEMKAGGLEAIKRQSDLFKQINYPTVMLLPEDGCVGPVDISLSKSIRLIIIDSEWWIHDWEKEPGINIGCEVQSRDELIQTLRDMVHNSRGEQIIFAFHHPLYNQGHHAGHFTFQDHVFPLTNVVDWLWLPLPIIGSIYPGYRSLIGHPQDIKHPRYRSLKEAILDSLDYEGSLIILSGHDHNLQYLTSGKHHQLVSGSAAKSNALANGKELMYGHQAPGFMELKFFADRTIELTIFEIDPDSGDAEIVFRRPLEGLKS